MVRKARSLDEAEAFAALSQLCQDYWYPLYAYVRRRGFSHHDAQDLIQAFFARLLEKRSIQCADEKRGNFRTFLLSSLNHFLSNEWDKQKAVKRGGKFIFVSWDELQAEERYGQEPFHEQTPAKLYDQRWAQALVEKTKAALRREYVAAGELAVFEALQGFLTRTNDPQSRKEVADRLGLTVNALNQRLCGMRRRFRELLRAEAAETMDEGADVDAELRHLFDVWE